MVQGLERRQFKQPNKKTAHATSSNQQIIAMSIISDDKDSAIWPSVGFLACTAFLLILHVLPGDNGARVFTGSAATGIDVGIAASVVGLAVSAALPTLKSRQQASRDQRRRRAIAEQVAKLDAQRKAQEKPGNPVFTGDPEAVVNMALRLLPGAASDQPGSPSRTWAKTQQHTSTGG